MVPQIPIQKLSRSRLVLEVCNTPTCEYSLLVCVIIGTKVNEQNDVDGPKKSCRKTVKKLTNFRGMWYTYMWMYSSMCVFIGTQVNEQSDSDGPTNSHTKTVKKSTGLRGM